MEGMLREDELPNDGIFVEQLEVYKVPSEPFFRIRSESSSCTGGNKYSALLVLLQMDSATVVERHLLFDFVQRYGSQSGIKSTATRLTGTFLKDSSCWAVRKFGVALWKFGQI